MLGRVVGCAQSDREEDQPQAQDLWSVALQQGETPLAGQLALESTTSEEQGTHSLAEIEGSRLLPQHHNSNTPERHPDTQVPSDLRSDFHHRERLGN